jgi:hypothetical protein
MRAYFGFDRIKAATLAPTISPAVDEKEPPRAVTTSNSAKQNA